jgi:alpha-L-fucosidase
MTDATWFQHARYGLFIHYGLYSLIGRGEWAMNREGWDRAAYRRLAEGFTAEHFDADAIADLAVQGGMRYVIFTTMHHDGFRLYDSALSEFTSVRAAPCRRDLLAEMVRACRVRGLRFCLYHSLNNWMDRPDSVDALEDPGAKARFIAATHARYIELAERYDFDVCWFDGWWPFDADGWQAEALLAAIRSHKPDVLFNPRSGHPGDFATPEGHMGAPSPWRPWEGCLSVNNSWGWHAGDHDWKSPAQIVDLLAAAAGGQGNLALNLGPRPDGSLPPEGVAPILAVGRWLRTHGEAVYGASRVLSMGLERRESHHNADWCHHGPVTFAERIIYQFLRRWPGPELILNHLQVPVIAVELLGVGALPFTQEGSRLRITLPDAPNDPVCPVVKLTCAGEPRLYGCGGQRIPAVPHPPYDPCPSELAGNPGGH